MKTMTMRQMLEAGVHLGHQIPYLNPKMKPYIYGVHYKIHIINLEISLPKFNEALKFAGNLAKNRGKLLFVGTKHVACQIVKQEAIRAGMPYVDYRWLGGMLTNYKTIRQSIKRLKELEKFIETDDAKNMTKKEMLRLIRKKNKLERCFSGIKNMGGLPDALFVLDTKQENIAVKEAQHLGIPVIGVVDTNANPDGIDYMIPGNDDAIRSIRLYCQAITDIIIETRGAVELEMIKQKESKAKEPEVKKVVKKLKLSSRIEEVSKDSLTEPQSKGDQTKREACDPKLDQSLKIKDSDDQKEDKAAEAKE